MLLQFSGPLWRWQGQAPAAWHFITVPEAESAMIRLAVPRRGFGSVRVAARIGETRWKTSLFPDNKRCAYLLPVKAAVRLREKLPADADVAVELALDL